MTTVTSHAPDTYVAKVDPTAVKLAVEDLDFYYGKTHALRSVSIPFEAKAVTALIGPSGCGKSTLLRALNRMYALYPGQKTGRVLLDGEDVLKTNNLSMLRARVGMVFQKPDLVPDVDLRQRGSSVCGSTRKPLACLADERAGVEESAQTRGPLGRGQGQAPRLRFLGFSNVRFQQRLCVARCIAVKPEILLLDEPTSAASIPSRARSSRRPCYSSRPTTPSS